MTRIWLFALCAAAAASFLTLAIADARTAGELAAPFAAAVLVVAVLDLCAARRLP
jgi:hypothetical protein